LQPQLIITPGASGGILTQSEYQLAQIFTEETLKTRTPDRLIRMICERDFVVKDIRAGSIWEIEKMITDAGACGNKIKDCNS
jgi:hypothetical protein